MIYVHNVSVFKFESTPSTFGIVPVRSLLPEPQTQKESNEKKKVHEQVGLRSISKHSGLPQRLPIYLLKSRDVKLDNSPSCGGI
eukprot:scaffold104897_cov45-Attheya_sp.AAC.1